MDPSGCILTKKLELHTPDEAIKLLGRNGEFRKYIQQQVPVRIVDRGSNVVIMGEKPDTDKVGSMLEEGEESWGQKAYREGIVGLEVSAFDFVCLGKITPP